ncbi:signal peptidase I [Paenibacillus hemerocallicola]|jgi:signal peptidase I|uniref:Signal peptidase I n=1 Tax=Paenibacillus hemerocallicola TaxID=1172614 RepID=A0A5C4T157_9BACL|nr:signal peptidase I [Paenibacillus hemerocallicola]TNJ62744.1 signal peptidase I [Paenibacillus hemerocallicola]
MQRVKAVLKEWVPPLAIAIILSLLIQTYVAQAVKVPSGSMEPNININDRLVMEKMLKFTDFGHGDIVVFNHAAENKDEVRYVKRLIGLPGDTIEVKEGILYRNGEKVDEPYLKAKMNYSFERITVPDNKYFFLGDNRNNSYDAHLWPNRYVDKSELVGKVLFRFYPFNHVGPL